MTSISKDLAHWAIILELKNQDDDERNLWLYHIYKSKESPTIGRFECVAYEENEHRHSVIDQKLIGETKFTTDQFRTICKKITEDFNKEQFDLVNHNCQNWCKMVLDKLAMEHDIIPGNEGCFGCLYLMKLVSSSDKLSSKNMKSF